MKEINKQTNKRRFSLSKSDAKQTCSHFTDHRLLKTKKKKLFSSNKVGGQVGQKGPDGERVCCQTLQRNFKVKRLCSCYGLTRKAKERKFGQLARR